MCVGSTAVGGGEGGGFSFWLREVSLSQTHSLYFPHPSYLTLENRVGIYQSRKAFNSILGSHFTFVQIFG